MQTSTDCEICGKKLTLRRLGRARRFCSSGCRQAAFRNAKFDPPYSRSAALRNASETPINSNGCKPENGDRGFLVSPRNILGGGYRWPNAVMVTPVKLRAVLRAELGDAFFDASTGWTAWPATAAGHRERLP